MKRIKVLKKISIENNILIKKFKKGCCITKQNLSKSIFYLKKIILINMIK